MTSIFADVLGMKCAATKIVPIWHWNQKIETGAVGDTKNRVSAGFRGLEKKRCYKCIISEWGYFEGYKTVINK